MVATQQGILTQHWQQFEQQRLTAQQQQEEVAYLAQALQTSNQVAASSKFSGAGIIRVAVADVGAEQQARVCSNAQYTVAETEGVIPTNLPSRRNCRKGEH